MSCCAVVGVEDTASDTPDIFVFCCLKLKLSVISGDLD